MLAASLRHPMHVTTAATLGCEVATVPGKVLKQMLEAPADREGHRALRLRLGDAAGVRRVAPRARRAVGGRPRVSVRGRMAVLQRKELEDSPLADLHAIASELGLEGFRTLRKADLIAAILDAQGGEAAEDERQRAEDEPEPEEVPAEEALEAPAPEPEPEPEPEEPERAGARGAGGDRRAACSTSCPTAAASCASILPGSRATTSTCRRPRSAAASCARATSWRVRCARRGATSAIPRSCAWRPSTAAMPSRRRSGRSSRS